MSKNWSINPVVESLSKVYGLDPSATDQWAIAMGDYLDNEVTEGEIKPEYWQARIKYVEFLDWLRKNRLRFPHSVAEADERVQDWLKADRDRP